MEAPATEKYKYSLLMHGIIIGTMPATEKYKYSLLMHGIKIGTMPATEKYKYSLLMYIYIKIETFVKNIFLM